MDSSTFRCLLLTLYGTGALVGETLNLRVGDFDFKRRRMTLGGNRIIGSRSLPICPDLLEELKTFACLKIHNNRAADQHFFRKKARQPLTEDGVGARFVHLRQLAAVRRWRVYQPRCAIYVSTFAVHRITSWIKDGADLNRMLPALAAYMGVYKSSVSNRNKDDGEMTRL
jgi:integrase